MNENNRPYNLKAKSGEFFMTQSIRSLTFVMLLTLFVVVGCGNQTTTTPLPQPEATSTAAMPNEGYPAPTLRIEPADPGYPAPEVTMPDMADSIPAPALPLQLEPSEVGATVGGIVVNRITEQAPLESLIYLGRLQFTETGLPVVSLNRQQAPVIILPRNGAFIFENLEPGSYAPIVFTPEYSTLIEDENGINVTFTVTDGDVIDLGTMIVDIP
jgi:hypothetical protein